MQVETEFHAKREILKLAKLSWKKPIWKKFEGAYVNLGLKRGRSEGDELICVESHFHKHSNDLDSRAHVSRVSIYGIDDVNSNNMTSLATLCMPMSWAGIREIFLALRHGTKIFEACSCCPKERNH